MQDVKEQPPWLCLTIKPGQHGLSSDEVAVQITSASSGLLEASPSVMSTLDGRESRRVHGTPGGDMGELLLAMSAIDDLTGGAYFTSEQRVLTMLEVIATTKGSFYHCTDTTAVGRLEAALIGRSFQLDESEARPPVVDKELLDALVMPEHVGCRHVRLVLQNPEVYGVRARLTQWAIQSFYRLFWTSAQSHRMHLVIHSGLPSEKAVVLVQTEHLVAPWFDAQTLVLHPAVVQSERARLAQWLCLFLRNHEEAHGSAATHSSAYRIEPKALLAAMNARGRTQLELTLDAIAGDLPVISARTDGAMLELFGAPASASSLGPLLLARECHTLRDLTPVDLGQGEQRAAAFKAINPFGKVPCLRSSEGVCLGESAAILRYVARTYGAKHLYPSQTDAAKCAHIDFAIDAFVNEGCLKGHAAVVLPLLGFAKPPPSQAAENEKYAAALEQWCEAFLASSRFVAGELPTIADYKVAPFLFACALPAVAALTGFRCPARVKLFVSEFGQVVPSAALLSAHPSGSSIGELLQAKLGTRTTALVPSVGAAAAEHGIRNSALVPASAATSSASPSAGGPVTTPAGGLLLGCVPPDFAAESTHGRLRLHEYIEGGWAVLFSQPDEFVPVSTTELGSVAQLLPQFTQRGCKVLALAPGESTSHARWAIDVLALARLPTDRGFPFPIVSDPDRKIAAQLGVAGGTEPAQGAPIGCSAVFVFAPDKTLRLSLVYPATTGCNFGEVLRAVDSLQMGAKHRVATPANWIPGKSVLVPPAVPDDEASASLPRGFAHTPVPSGKRYVRVAPDPTSA